MDTRADLEKSKTVVPGESRISEPLDRVTSDEGDHQMPPKGDRLMPKQVAVLEAWIDRDLPWESGFNFKANRLLTEVATVQRRRDLHGLEHDSPADVKRVVRPIPPGTVEEKDGFSISEWQAFSAMGRVVSQLDHSVIRGSQ